MSKWIAEFELEDGDTMPEHMDLEYMGAKIDFHCRPITEYEDAISRQAVLDMATTIQTDDYSDNEIMDVVNIEDIKALPSVQPKPKTRSRDDNVPDKNEQKLSEISTGNVTHKIAEFFSNWDGDESAKMEISVNDMREIAFVYSKKARIERQL